MERRLPTQGNRAPVPHYAPHTTFLLAAAAVAALALIAGTQILRSSGGLAAHKVPSLTSGASTPAASTSVKAPAPHA